MELFVCRLSRKKQRRKNNDSLFFRIREKCEWSTKCIRHLPCHKFRLFMIIIAISSVCESRRAATLTPSENLCERKKFTLICSYAAMCVRIAHAFAASQFNPEQRENYNFSCGFFLHSNCSWISLINIVYSTSTYKHNAFFCVFDFTRRRTSHARLDSLFFFYFFFFCSCLHVCRLWLSLCTHSDFSAGIWHGSDSFLRSPIFPDIHWRSVLVC